MLAWALVPHRSKQKTVIFTHKGMNTKGKKEQRRKKEQNQTCNECITNIEGRSKHFFLKKRYRSKLERIMKVAVEKNLNLQKQQLIYTIYRNERKKTKSQPYTRKYNYNVTKQKREKEKEGI